MRITVELQPERDRAIVAWLERQMNRSEAIRAALRAYLEPAAGPLAGNGVRLEDVLEAVNALERKIMRSHAGRWERDSAGAENTAEMGDAAGTGDAAENLARLGLG